MTHYKRLCYSMSPTPHCSDPSLTRERNAATRLISRFVPSLQDFEVISAFMVDVMSGILGDSRFAEGDAQDKESEERRARPKVSS